MRVQSVVKQEVNESTNNQPFFTKHATARQTGMASYLSSLASPGFHAGPSPNSLAAAAAMAAAVSSGPYGGAGGSSHDAADDFFASPSPR